MYLFMGNTGTTIQSSLFENNRALLSGGALLVLSGHAALSLSNNGFTNNSAVANGGALSIDTNNGVGILLSGNNIVIELCTFAFNSAANGGAVYLQTGNVVTFASGTTFVNNNAKSSGGGVYLNTQNSVEYTDCVLIYNTAGASGGGLSSAFGNSVVMGNVNFTQNTAVVGGGMSMEASTMVQFASTAQFQSNVAIEAGGAIASISSPLWVLSNGSILLFQENIAGAGSALFFKALVQSANSLNNLLFYRNAATVGGTVYWVYETTGMTAEPPGL